MGLLIDVGGLMFSFGIVFFGLNFVGEVWFLMLRGGMGDLECMSGLDLVCKVGVELVGVFSV